MKIMVTGGAGYLGTWIVRTLLDHGHEVHATVRDLHDAGKLPPLYALARQHSGRLHLYAADLCATADFDAPMQGCDAVIHAASPYFLHADRNPAQTLLAPAIEGTRNVLAAASRCPTVRRVVVTSSIVTLYNDARSLSVPIDETGHSQHALRDAPYALSKQQAEAVAREMAAAQTQWSLVTLHPGAIFGPSLSQRTDATSVQMVRDFLRGQFKAGVPDLSLGIVDVRDVALAHVLAATRPTAHDRYLLVAQSMRLIDMAAVLRGYLPAAWRDRQPTRTLPKALIWLLGPWIGMPRRYVARNVGHPLPCNASRSLRELLPVYRPATDTLCDHARQLLDDGLLEAA
ncbi:Nucleoside-diphosphate-sugar epimerase [Andreprevotia lacus DSM 23236]|jgi:nucleoside-diphosphate-sugar epimerase|uniref:Nucleoside-diphosphate-sugar epimerase n=1 Tax=Andreprevotia lacus DSM 23236 TaxID=1121001 RepID=A0A1W1XZ96_9NEIS|nr:NAD-dependent epimerase/dehydratase family protein [Andreprevotia lacus]SMC29233.1 Nucleoside-diphosphate-sugar epimerase [Andreprevotia lacus DSM 23236]